MIGNTFFPNRYDHPKSGAVFYIKDLVVTLTRSSSVIKSFTSDFTGGAGDNSDEIIQGYGSGLTPQFETNQYVGDDSGWLKMKYNSPQTTTVAGICLFVEDSTLNLWIPAPGTTGDILQIDYKIYYVDPNIVYTV